MVGWHYQFNGREFEQMPGDNGGQPVHGVAKSRTQLGN